MTSQRSLSRGSDLLRRHLDESPGPTSFAMLDREWVLLDGVFSPLLTPVTELFTRWIPYPHDGTFLEMGCGAGLTAVVAAESGCSHVTALDISPAATLNTRVNAERRGVLDRMRIAQSDLFAALTPGDRFDMIYWNSNFVETPIGSVNASDLHHAFFDPGYETHRRFVREVSGWLADRGRILLGFSDLGSRDLLESICAASNLRVSTLKSAERTKEITITYQLLELHPESRPQGDP